MNYGIQITYKDLSTEYFDPIQDFKTTNLNYEFWVSGHTYQILIDTVLELRKYPLCDVCGYEDSEEGCKNCAEKEEIEKLRNEK